MIPYKNTTRDRIIQVAMIVAQRLKHTCLELSRLVCYHEILEKDLCATVMDDGNYWQNRKTMYRIGESSMEFEPFSKDILEATLKAIEPIIDSNKKEKHSTITLLPMSSTSSLSTMTTSSTVTGSSHTTPPRSPDNDGIFSVSQTGNEIKKLKNKSSEEESFFKDDSSSILSLEFEDAQENFDEFDIEAYEEEYEKLQASGVLINYHNFSEVQNNNQYEEIDDDDDDDNDVFVDAEDWYSECT
jgi:hypothetical protein